MYRPSLIALLVVAATLSALADETAAGTLRWAGRGDLQTADLAGIDTLRPAQHGTRRTARQRLLHGPQCIALM